MKAGDHSLDTGTHLVMGLGLFGLSHLDPQVATDSSTMQAVLIGTIVGSQIPDIDTLYRLKGNNPYIRNHRGWTHSLPMLFIWPLILSILFYYIFPDASISSIIIWTSLAVWVHIFIDLFNSYGTQVLRPFSKKWVHFHVLHIFDPFIFTIHVVGLAIWRIGGIRPDIIFLLVYFLICIYIGWRSWEHYQKLQLVKKLVPNAERSTLLPTYKYNYWYVIVEQDHEVFLGELKGRKLHWMEKVSFSGTQHPICVEKSKEAPAVKAFLSFSDYAYVDVIPNKEEYEVRWVDIRYLHKKRFPLIAIAILNKNFEVKYSFVGWRSHEEINKKVNNLST